MSGHLAVEDFFLDMPQLALFYELVQTSSWAAATPRYQSHTGHPHACAIVYVMVLSTLHRA